MEFIDLYNSTPRRDHISANKALKTEGFFKRLQDMLRIYKHRDEMINNIFAPTAAIKLLNHINT